jgi:hypothetical protein
MTEKIRVTFKRVFVRDTADWFGSGEFYFDAKVDGQQVGDRQIFDARQGKWIALQPDRWSQEIDVTGKSAVDVIFNGRDEDVFFDEDLGTIKYTLRSPWQQNTHTHHTEYFSLEWSIELQVHGAYGVHPPNEVFACRALPGNADCTTVSGVPIVARVEVHPVRPVPARILFRGLVPPLDAVENKAGVLAKPTDPPNIVPNPAVIPILTQPGITPAPGEPPVADATNAARIEVTFYRPSSLQLDANPHELEWSARSLVDGAAVSFLGPAQGTKVLVYGTAPGQIALDVKFRGQVMATYRALVLRLKSIPCRVNILNGPTESSQPRSRPEDVVDHLSIANRYLRQAGVELVLDTSSHTSDGAQATSIPGVFRIRVAAGVTMGIDAARASMPATRLNYRPNVLNFAYVHSAKGRVLGATTDTPASKIPAAPGERPTVRDGGTPSSSWIRPSGVLPDSAAIGVNMDLVRARHRPGHPKLFAMLVADKCGDPAVFADQQRYGHTIAHEVGHILNLGHRVEGPHPDNPDQLIADGAFSDGLTHPPRENLMHWNAPDSEAQDLDILQALAIQQSPLVS